MNRFKPVTPTNAVKDLCILFMSAEDQPIVINRATRSRVEITPAVHELLGRYRHPWSILLMAYGYLQGAPILQSELLIAKRPCLDSDLQQHMTQAHMRLDKAFEGDEFVGFAWIACPDGSDPWGADSRRAYDLLEHFDAFVKNPTQTGELP